MEHRAVPAGRSADYAPLAPAEAGRFGELLAAIHQPAPDGFPHNDYRGVPLVDVADRVDERLRQLATVDTLELPLAAVRERWRSAVAAFAEIGRHTLARLCAGGET